VTAVAIALVVVGLALVVAVWDAMRRALASQVRLGGLRVEAQQRHDLGELAALVAQLRRDHDGLEQSIALGRRGR
jgi:hypothetical protein